MARKGVPFRQHGVYWVIEERNKGKLLRHRQGHKGKVYLALMQPLAYFSMLPHKKLQLHAGMHFGKLRNYAGQEVYGQAEKAANAKGANVRSVYAANLFPKLLLAVDYLAHIA